MHLRQARQQAPGRKAGRRPRRADAGQRRQAPALPRSRNIGCPGPGATAFRWIPARAQAGFDRSRRPSAPGRAGASRRRLRDHHAGGSPAASWRDPRRPGRSGRQRHACPATEGINAIIGSTRPRLHRPDRQTDRPATPRFPTVAGTQPGAPIRRAERRWSEPAPMPNPASAPMPFTASPLAVRWVVSRCAGAYWRRRRTPCRPARWTGDPAGLTRGTPTFGTAISDDGQARSAPAPSAPRQAGPKPSNAPASSSPGEQTAAPDAGW